MDDRPPRPHDRPAWMDPDPPPPARTREQAWADFDELVHSEALQRRFPDGTDVGVRLYVDGRERRLSARQWRQVHRGQRQRRRCRDERHAEAAARAAAQRARVAEVRRNMISEWGPLRPPPQADS